MSAFRPRNRLVVFRLSEQEYQDLKTACIAGAARSLSEFARSAVIQSIHEEVALKESLDRRLSSLDRRLALLESGIQQVLQILQGAKYPAARTP